MLKEQILLDATTKPKIAVILLTKKGKIIKSFDVCYVDRKRGEDEYILMNVEGNQNLILDDLNKIEGEVITRNSEKISVRNGPITYHLAKIT